MSSDFSAEKKILFSRPYSVHSGERNGDMERSQPEIVIPPERIAGSQPSDETQGDEKGGDRNKDIDDYGVRPLVGRSDAAQRVG